MVYGISFFVFASRQRVPAMGRTDHEKGDQQIINILLGVFPVKLSIIKEQIYTESVTARETRVHSHAPSILSHRKPVCIYLFREKIQFLPPCI